VDIFDIEKEYDKDYTAADIDKSTCHQISDDIYVVSAIGMCPVEYCGIIDEYCFYFKSRGETWGFSIAESKHASRGIDDENFQFSCSGRFTDEKSHAGYMPTEQAEALIKGCVALWKLGKDKDV